MRKEEDLFYSKSDTCAKEPDNTTIVYIPSFQNLGIESYDSRVEMNSRMSYVYM